MLDNFDKPPPMPLTIRLWPVAAIRALMSPAVFWRVSLHEAAMTIIPFALCLLNVVMGVMPSLLRLVPCKVQHCSFVSCFMALP